MVESTGLFHWTPLDSTVNPLDLSNLISSFFIFVRLSYIYIYIYRWRVINKVLKFVQATRSGHVTSSHVKCWLIAATQLTPPPPPPSTMRQDKPEHDTTSHDATQHKQKGQGAKARRTRCT